MKWAKSLFLVGALVFVFTLAGCYTAVMVTKRVHRVETEDIIVEEEPYEDVIEEYDEEGDRVIHEHTYYGDLWGWTGFDPYWSSPYWWTYASWRPWRWGWWGFYDPWLWDPWYYGWGYGGYGGYGYYGGYYDPYWAYYGGYYSPSPTKRRPFTRREARHRRDADETMVSAPARSGGGRVSKVSSTDEGTGRRVRKDISDRTRITKRSGSADRSMGERRVRKPSSGKTTERVRSRSTNVRVLKRVRPSSSVRKSTIRRGASSSSRRVRSYSSGRRISSRSGGRTYSSGRRSVSSGRSSSGVRSTSRSGGGSGGGRRTKK
jgi:hypothetical protein